MREVYSETEVYHPLEVVGTGTFGEVAKCFRGSDGYMVAIKTMKIEHERNRVIRNELKLVDALSRADLANSNIIHHYETFRDQTHYYLVFELLEKSLYQLQKENGFRPMAMRNIRTITHQMLKALAKLKDLGIIHADLKPENVMVVDQGHYPFHVKLIDFGSASILSEVRSVKEPYIQSRFYRSPEILLGLPFSEKADMWSLGCVMGELFTGWPLYPGESEQDQIRYICEAQGQPRDNLLNKASKAKRFFNCYFNNRGQHFWQLKHTNKRRTSVIRGGGSVRRKYIITSLDQLTTLELGPVWDSDPGSRAEEQDEGVRTEDTAARVVDRRSMVELLKRMLTLDSNTRIQPTTALKHPFISLSHLGSSAKYGHYRAASQLAYERARVLEKVAVDDIIAGSDRPRAKQSPGGVRSVDYNSQHAPARTEVTDYSPISSSSSSSLSAGLSTIEIQDLACPVLSPDNGNDQQLREAVPACCSHSQPNHGLNQASGHQTDRAGGERGCPSASLDLRGSRYRARQTGQPVYHCSDQ